MFEMQDAYINNPDTALYKLFVSRYEQDRLYELLGSFRKNEHKISYITGDLNTVEMEVSITEEEYVIIKLSLHLLKHSGLICKNPYEKTKR